MSKVLYYKIEVDTGDANRKLLGEMTAQLKVINDEYKKLISSKEKDTAKIGANREQYAALTKDINTLSKAILSSTAASEKDAAEKIKFANDVKNANNKLEAAYIASEAKKAAAAEREAIAIKNAQNRLEEAYAKAEAKREAKIQANTFEAGSIAALRQELSKATMAYDRMGEAERNSAAGKQMETSIAMQVQALNKLEQATGRFQRQVGNYNTAGVAMSQVLREIPAFAFSAQTGILALSNNIPILVDEMKRISTSIDAVTGKKTGWAGAFKQMGANLLSFGSIMTVALGLFTIFSDKIFEAIIGTDKLTEAQKKLIEEQERAIIQNQENINSWKVFNGELTISQAAMADLELQIGSSLAAIEKDTQEKLTSVHGFWNTLLTDFEALIGFAPGVTGWLIRMQEEAKILGEAAIKEEQLMFQTRVEQNNKLIDIANKYRQKVRELQINAIEDELTRERAKINERRRIAIEEATLSMTDPEIQAQTISEINKAFDLELTQIKIHSDKKKEKKIEEHDFIADITAAEINLITSKYIKEMSLENENYRKIIESYNKKKLEYPQNVKDINKLIELAEKQHQVNIAKINDDANKETLKSQSEDRLSKLRGINSTMDYHEKIQKEVKEHNEELEKEQKQSDAKRLQNIREIHQFLTDATNQYFKMQEDAIRRHLKNQEAILEKDAERQNDILKNRLDKGLITEAQYNADKAELDRKTQELKIAEQKKAFEEEKKLAKAKIAIATAVAIIETYMASGGNYYVATVKALGITAISLAQMAAVDAQEFAEGGLVLDRDKNIPTKANGDSVLTTLTPGEIVLNKQQQAMLGGNKTFAAIGVPNVPNVYPSAASGGSQSTMTKKDFQIMFNSLGRQINSKKVISVESESRRIRNNVENYESQAKW